MFSQRAFRALWVLPALNLVVGEFDLALGLRLWGALNLLAGVLVAGLGKWLEDDGKINFRELDPVQDGIGPQDHEFRSIHEQL